ncbi:hypothetical protein LIER_02566 [Lithospermum erythrorhizon]|uniref:Uncharacterized protein n=1 Tax=Lithospermum erythrorhizon TaxID=34254 RepID=A0AAV3NPX2_LITER
MGYVKVHTLMSVKLGPYQALAYKPKDGHITIVYWCQYATAHRREAPLPPLLVMKKVGRPRKLRRINAIEAENKDKSLQCKKSKFIPEDNVTPPIQPTQESLNDPYTNSQRSTFRGASSGPSPGRTLHMVPPTRNNIRHQPRFVVGKKYATMADLTQD